MLSRDVCVVRFVEGETMITYRFALAIAAALTLGACASGPPKTAATHARNDNALAAQPQIMQEAQQRLDQALTAANSGDNRTAIRLADEAKADADLADAAAQADVAEKAAQTVRSDIGTLQQTTAPK
jgi:hypothetical protein